MRIRRRPRIALAMLALYAMSWASTAAAPAAAPVSTRPALAAHHCSHCPPSDCSTLNHCVVGSPAALCLGPAFLLLPASSARPEPQVSQPPLSANPTPPNPPPQPVL